MSAPELASQPPKEGSESGVDYNQLLAEAKSEARTQGDVLRDDQYPTEGRSEDAVRDEYRAYAAKPQVEWGMKNEAKAAESKTSSDPEASVGLARKQVERAQDNFAKAQKEAQDAATLYDQVKSAQRGLDSLTDPDRKI